MKLREVTTGKKDFDLYSEIIDFKLHEEIIKLADKFRGRRILHINSTEAGGGVAQLLKSVVPLTKDLGIDSHWYVVEAPIDFFVITKKLHNGLQGAKVRFSDQDWKLYEKINKQFAEFVQPSQWDFIFIHDPQPAGIINYLEKAGAKWVWRCHIDLSKSNLNVVPKFLPYLEKYDGYVFTLKQYIFPALRKHRQRVGIVPVAIDPLTEKNELLDIEEARQVVAGYGVNVNKPLMVQISRFDPWKDPLGVIEAWRLAKIRIPNLQLVLMGDGAADDPEGQNVLEQVLREAQEEEGLFIITDSNDTAVNALQTAADVVLQKSIREGFGLTVSEALWAKTPVVGGNVGGIPSQVENGKDGYLVSTPKEAAKRVVQIINNPIKARRMGQWGHEYVRRNFLMPHMIKNELKFLQKL